MFPQLTETWGSAYLQVLAGFLVFAWGIPALAVQIAVAPEIRSVVERRFGHWACGILVSVLCIACLLLIWVFHPCRGLAWSDYRAALASLCISVAVCAVAGYWWWIIRSYTRGMAIRGLVRDLMRGHRRTGMLDERLVSSLVSLGSHGRPGEERRLALEGLETIVDSVHSASDYTGEQLEEILRGIGAVVLGTTEMGSTANFRDARRVLDRATGATVPTSNVSAQDSIAALATLMKLGTSAIESLPEDIALEYVQAAEQSSEVLARFGLSGLQRRRYLCAVAALSKLEALAVRAEHRREDDMDKFLGLVAHFSAVPEAASRWAAISLNRVQMTLRISMDVRIEAAQTRAFRSADFDGANALGSLRRSVSDPGGR